MFFSRKNSLTSEIKCGVITEAEYFEKKEVHKYKIILEPEDTLSVWGKPLGAFLTLDAKLFGPQENLIVKVTGWKKEGQKLELKTPPLSARGEYTLFLRNYFFDQGRSGSGGIYELHIGCKKRNGTIIEPSLETKG